MITEYKISDGKQNLSIRVIRSRRKTVGLEVKTDGNILARIPGYLTDGELEKFLEEHKGWILKKVKLLEERQKDMEPSRACPVRELLPEDIEKIKKRFSERGIANHGTNGGSLSKRYRRSGEERGKRGRRQLLPLPCPPAFPHTSGSVRGCC